MKNFTAQQISQFQQSAQWGLSAGLMTITRPPGKRPRWRDIAAHCGCSTGMAQHVYDGSRDNPALKQTVLAALARFGHPRTKTPRP